MKNFILGLLIGMLGTSVLQLWVEENNPGLISNIIKYYATGEM